MSLSEKAARFKFDGTKPYFSHLRIAAMPRGFGDGAPEADQAVLYYGRPPSRFVLDDAWLVEAIAYADGTAHVIAIGRSGARVDVAFPQHRVLSSAPRSVTVAMIATAGHPYESLFLEAVEYYRAQGVSICAALYGFEKQPDGIRAVMLPKEGFSMAEARNLAIALASPDEMVLELDVDVRLDVGSVLAIASEVPSHGVFGLKVTDETGSGLFAGMSSDLSRCRYDRAFRGFWCEDTERLQQFSRIGIVPVIAFLDFEILDHDRRHTLVADEVDRNVHLMRDRILWGRRCESDS